MPSKSIFVAFILLSISMPASLLAQDNEVSGASRDVQEKAVIVQARGRDAQVDYRALTRSAPSDAPYRPILTTGEYLH